MIERSHLKNCLRHECSIKRIKEKKEEDSLYEIKLPFQSKEKLVSALNQGDFCWFSLSPKDLHLRLWIREERRQLHSDVDPDGYKSNTNGRFRIKENDFDFIYESISQKEKSFEKIGASKVFVEKSIKGYLKK